MKRNNIKTISLSAGIIFILLTSTVPLFGTCTSNSSENSETPLLNDHLTSTNRTATLGKKIIRAGTDSTLHFIYLSKCFLYYTLSKDKGATWKEEELLPAPPSTTIKNTFVFEEGFTLALDQSNQPHVVFVRRYPTQQCENYKYEMWHTQKLENGRWSTPQLLYRAEGYYIGYNTLEIDTNGFGHVSFIQVTGQFHGVHYFRFNTFTGDPVETSHKYFADAYSYDMDLDTQGNPHVVYWYRGYYHLGVVYQYWNADQGRWSDPFTVFPGICDYFNLNPKITVAPNNDVHIIWTYQDDYYRIDSHYRKLSQGVWSDIEQATQNSLGGWSDGLVLINNQPCIIINDFIEHDGWYDYDVFCAVRGDEGWLGGRECISNSPTVRSLYPRSTAVGSTLYTFWTEGNVSPYTLSFDRRTPNPTTP